MKLFVFLLWTIACGFVAYETWPYAEHIISIIVAIVWLFSFMVVTGAGGSGSSSGGDGSWFSDCDCSSGSSDCGGDSGCSD